MTGDSPDTATSRAGISSDQATADVGDLQQRLADLAGLVTGSLGLAELLGHVAGYAAHAIPGADGAGVTVLRVGRPDHRVEALAASHPFVNEIDEIQYATVNEGPCITAALERRTVRSGSLGGEKMCPRFGPRVGRLGIPCALSLPLLVPGQIVGAINVYAHGKDVFRRPRHAGTISCVLGSARRSDTLMQITAALAADLALLSDALGDPVTEVVGDITDTVLELAADARLAARSDLGLTVIIGNAQSDGEVEPVPEIALRFTRREATRRRPGRRQNVTPAAAAAVADRQSPTSLASDCGDLVCVEAGCLSGLGG